VTETAPSAEERTSSVVQPGDLTAKLAKCREKAGLDIEQAAEELHLSPHILKALEQEDFAHLPEPPYVRGYLRGYSKLADMDAKELIRIYEALRGAKPDEIAHHFAPARPLNKVAQPVMSASTVKFIGFGAIVLLLGLFSMIPGVRDWANHTWSSFSAQTNPPDVPRPPSAMEAYVAQKEALEREKAVAEAQAKQTVTPTPEPVLAQETVSPTVLSAAPVGQTVQNNVAATAPIPEPIASITPPSTPVSTPADTTAVTPVATTDAATPAPSANQTTVASTETSTIPSTIPPPHPNRCNNNRHCYCHTTHSR
jgi:Uncharacterized protein conserved in bacteria